MLSLLVISESLENSKQFVENFCEKEHIHPVDLTFFEYPESIGVENIRDIQKTLYLKPIKGEKKAVCIVHADTATREAQNALLKALEEPPNNTQIILTATTTQSMLPTILSRCKIIYLDEKKETLSKDEQKTYQQEFAELSTSGISFRLKQAQDLAADKQAAQLWLKHMIISLRDVMIHEEKYHLVSVLADFQQAYTLLQSTNINPRMIFENLFLNISSQE